MEHNHVATIHAPAPVTALAFGGIDGSDLYVGCQDGSVRLFDLPGTRVIRAISGLQDEIASIVIASTTKNKKKKSTTRQVWVACEDQVHLVDFVSDKLVLSRDDIVISLTVGLNKEDALNELSISSNGAVLAFTSDNGSVGVMDVGTRRVSRMKTMHENIASTVNFVPDRPNELVSGGYDCVLLHFDHVQGSMLSKHSCGKAAGSQGMESGISLSPPFVLCSAMGATGVLAAGTADGRIWVGTGGEKGALITPGKKKARKWSGLATESTLDLVIAEGPVVGVTFTSPLTIAACSLLGNMFHLTLKADGQGNVSLEKTHTAVRCSVSKANTLVSNEKWLAMGGFNSEGKGIVEIWAIS